jgi:hypothetical protein
MRVPLSNLVSTVASSPGWLRKFKLVPEVFTSTVAPGLISPACPVAESVWKNSTQLTKRTANDRIFFTLPLP